MSSPEHSPIGDPCSRCGMYGYRHRSRGKRLRTDYHRLHSRKRDRSDRPKRQDRIIFIDGEGQGRSPHIYNFLAGVDEKGQEWSVSRVGGLRTKRVFDFLLSLPSRSLVFGFALGYDITKWLTDLPNKTIHSLLHEDTRAFIKDGRVLYHPKRWNGYKLNYCNRQLSVSKGSRSVAIWDIFAFFQCKFTKALTDWKICSKEEIDYIAEMKEKRSQFDRLNSAKVEAYCKSECRNGAKLGRALLNAHKEAGLPLRSKFHGAGSTASVFLAKLKIRRKRGKFPEAMKHAIACAFFGGRFENSFIGPIRTLVYNNDISSAYPYQATFLPCLRHGKWELVSNPRQKTIDGAALALCHWTIPKTDVKRAWGVLPVRSSIGTIAFPTSAVGGWCWKREFQVASKLSDVVCSEAWLYHTDCDCAPFKSIPQYYLERLRIGKEGPGIVLKLGLNSIYGKLAQSKGVNPPFQSWIWAGNITSGTRAQLLEALLVVKNPWDILMMATDGIYSRVPLGLPKPRFTGTDITVKCVDGSKTRKPLGGWEEKKYEKGVFCVRPGIYFPIDPTKDEIEKVRARGLGRKTVYDKWPEIIRAWKEGRDGLSIGGYKPNGEPYLSRFIGAKSAISVGSRSGYKRSPRYGEWIPHKIKVGFSPWPKRESKMKDGRLKPWGHFNWESVPYKAAMENPEAAILDNDTEMMLEQPDGCDFSEYQ